MTYIGVNTSEHTHAHAHASISITESAEDDAFEVLSTNTTSLLPNPQKFLVEKPTLLSYSHGYVQEVVPLGHLLTTNLLRSAPSLRLATHRSLETIQSLASPTLPPLSTAFAILVVFAMVQMIVTLVQGVSARKRFRTLENRYGCASPRAVPNPFPWGLRHKFNLLTQQGGDILDNFFAEKYRNNGPTHALYDTFGIPRVIHTIDPVNLNAVLCSSFDDWRPSKSRTNTIYPLAQDGLLTTEGQKWHKNRKLIQRHIGGRKVKDVSSAEKDIKLLFEAVGRPDEEGWSPEVDLLELFHRLALDLSTSYLLGTSANSQASSLLALDSEENGPNIKAKRGPFGWLQNRPMTYGEAYEIVRNHFSWRSKLGSKYWLADSLEYRRACSTLNSFADGLIQKAVERSSQSAKQHDEQESVADFALVDSLVEEFKDPVMVRDLVMDLFIAGQNMTGTIAAWVFAQLERNPVVFRDLRREIIDMFGTEHNPKAPIIWDNLRACTQLQHVIHETLRMYPLLANIGRNAKRDTVLPRGGGPDGTQPIAVPRGTSLTCNVYLMHRSQEDWNEDAWEFKPSRWAGRKFGPEYAPFGAGPRICIGQQLAITELSYLIARMLQHFSEIKAPEGQDNLVKGYRVVVAPKHGVLVRLRKAT